MKQSALRVLCLCAFLTGIVWNLLFSIADLEARRNQPQSTRLAMRLMPQNGAYAAQLADEVYASDPQEAESLLRRAVKLNAYDPASWVQLALLYEARHDLPKAEAALLKAAAVDSTFVPSWSLTNFYFRHDNSDRFWYWAKKSAQMIPDDATALLRLAWYANPDPREIQSRLQLNSPAIQGQFVNFLVTQGKPEAVAEAAAHLLTMPPGENGNQTLLQACDWLLAQKRPGLALTLWNGLAPRVTYTAPTVNAPVTNGDFAAPPSSHGFDWRLSANEGASSFLNASPSTLGFEFSGHEPDNLVLMSQVAPVLAGKDYLLSVDYVTSGLSANSGIAWEISDERTGAILAQTGSLSAEQGDTARARFTVPPGTAFVRLSLLYRRQPGTVRVEGKLTLKRVFMQLQP
jgi:tetratricopeptide (TPR) repeat protein